MDKLFEAYLDESVSIERKDPRNPALSRYHEALEFLTHDSDWHVQQMEEKGLDHYEALMTGFSSGAIQWSSQVSLMTLAAFHASLVISFARARTYADTLN